jgi:uncharacterized protein (TIGR03067 family)
MRRHVPTIVLGCLGMMAAVVIVAPAGGAPPEDRDELRGTWKLVSSIREKEKVVPGDLERSELVFEGETYRIKRGDTLEKGTYSLDASKAPKAIDVVPGEGPNKGQTIKGIYKCEGKTLSACVGRPGKDRPTSFDAETNDEHMLFVYEKVGP